MTGATGSRWALAGLVAAMLVVHGVVGWWSPLQGDDWQYVLGAAGRGRGWLAAYPQLADVCGSLLVRAPLVHALVSPVVGVSLVLGTFALGAGRLPDPRRWRDVLGVALVSAMIWIALPRAGAMWFHRSYAAAQIYGAALVVWFLVPFRCRWQRAGAGWQVAMFAVGLAAGATTRQLQLAAVIGAAIAVRRTPRSGRPAWMVPGLAGAALGLLAGLARWQLSDLVYVFGHLERSLARMAPVLEAGAPVIAVIALGALARQLGARNPPAPATAPPVGSDQDAGWPGQAPDAGQGLAWLGAWLGLGLAAQLGPRSTAATQLPAALALCAGALPYLTWLASARRARWLLAGLAIGVHVVAWSLALSTYAALGAEFRDRMAAIARTPAGQVATVRRYADLIPGFWSVGEDWADLGARATLARARWGLAGIDLVPVFRQLERSPDLQLVLEVDGASPDQLAAAAAPAWWPRELGPARAQFTPLLGRLRAIAGRGVTARLRVVDLDFAARRGRPVLAAWSDGAGAMVPDPARSRADDADRVTISIAPDLATQFDEAWLVGPWGSAPAAGSAGRYAVTEQHAGRTVLVACNAERCVAVEAWVPLF